MVDVVHYGMCACVLVCVCVFLKVCPWMFIYIYVYMRPRPVNDTNVPDDINTGSLLFGELMLRRVVYIQWFDTKYTTPEEVVSH